MKKLLLSVLVLVLFFTSQFLRAQKTTIEQSISKTLLYLTSDALEGRDPARTETFNLASNYLENILKEAKIKPYFNDSYKDALTTFPNTHNLVGFIEGTDPELKKEFVILSAHFDHIGIISPVAGDSIANGANDNASGTTIVSEIAKALAKEKKLKRSVLVVFFSAEEKGLLGSKHLAKKLKENSFNLYAMLNLEMLGVPMNRTYKTYLTGFHKSNMAEKLNEYAENKNFIGKSESDLKYDLFNASDNVPFYNEFQVPCHSLSSFDFANFSYYHHVKDEFSQMDIPFMAQITKELIPVVVKLVNAPKNHISNVSN